MPENIKIGFVGCGMWAQKKYLPFLGLDKSIEIRAMSDINTEPEKLSIISKHPNIKFYDTARQMINSEKLDGVLVSLPHAKYFYVIQEILNHHIPVLSDKPSSTSAIEISELVNIADQTKTFFAVNSQRRAFPGISKAQELIQSKTLGTLHWIRYDFLVSSYPNWQKTWRNDPFLSGISEKKQGILLDTGFHCIDSILFSLNYVLPTSVYAKAKYHHSKVETDVVALLEFEQGFTASVLVTRNMPKGYEREVMAVLGEKGYYSSQIEEKEGVKHSRKILALSGQEPQIENFDTNEAVVKPLSTFINFIKGKKDSKLFLAKNIIPAMVVIDALYESILSGQKVTIDT